MSYSFNVAARTKSELKAAIAAEFDKIVASQPPHAIDRLAAVNAANAFVDLTSDAPDGKVLGASIYGSLSWVGSHPDPLQITHANLSVQISHVVA